MWGVSSSLRGKRYGIMLGGVQGDCPVCFMQSRIRLPPGCGLRSRRVHRIFGGTLVISCRRTVVALLGEFGKGMTLPPHPTGKLLLPPG